MRGRFRPFESSYFSIVPFTGIGWTAIFLVRHGTASCVCCVCLCSCCTCFVPPRRRLVRPLLLSLLSSKLRPGGVLNVATDVEEYAEHVVAVMSSVTSPSGQGLRSSSLMEEEEGLDHDNQKHARDAQHQLQLEHVTMMVKPPRQARTEAGRDRAEACWEGGEVVERPSWRPLTKYEAKAREAGRHVRDFRYRLVQQLPQAPSPG